MRKLTSNEIRNMWIKYFTAHGHKLYPSASLIPVNDDTLLWTNAGVTPLKKYFDGSVVPEDRRIVSIQKCIRTNDIDNVGVTKRHQTFFEMMGNFSIGDYFRNEAIEFSFELLTSKDWFDIPKELIYVTIYQDDDESFNKWVEVGLDPSHVIRLEGNFWEIGEGPCGPDSEIFFDRGEKYDPDKDAFEKFSQDIDQERFVEIWNNVFSQYNSKEGVERKDYKELPSKNIDTGAGLERWATIFQGVDSSFETDLFQPIIKHTEELTGCLYRGQKEFKVIADHVRTLVVAIADGATFENTGRGYVLRRLLRRSIRMGKNLGLNDAFLYKLVDDVILIFKDTYQNIIDNKEIIIAYILEEEKLFMKTLDSGEKKLKEMMSHSKNKKISGADVFKLYDTYGFPFELTLECLEEAGFTTSKEDFDKHMERQKQLAKKNVHSKTSMASQKKALLDFTEDSTFVYGIYRLKSNVIGIFRGDSVVKKLTTEGYIALKRTCFYAESGGQVSDTGMIIGKGFKARVLDVFKAPNGQHIHKVRVLDGVINIDEDCELIVDKARRKEIEANHSSVHILQYTLQTLVDPNIKQAGSYVDSEKLRFDFTTTKKITDMEIAQVEDYVNEFIKKNVIVSTEIMPLEKALNIGAMALFGEKYKEKVRVVKIGKSIELCGGTHATNTADIDGFAIYNFESKGSNVYRIEAETSSKKNRILLDVIKPYNDEKIKLLMKARNIINEAKKLGINLEYELSNETIKPTSYKDVIASKNEVESLKEDIKELEKKFNDLKTSKSLDNIDMYKRHIKSINNKHYLIMEINDLDNQILKSIADKLANEYEGIFVFFSNIKEDSVSFIAKTNLDIDASFIIKEVSMKALGNGGGNSNFAQGGGKDLSNLKDIYSYVEEQIKNG